MRRVCSSTCFVTAVFFLLFSFGSAQNSPPEVTALPLQTGSSIATTVTDLFAPPEKRKQAAEIPIFARSDTVYMKTATIRSWLQRQPEFDELGLAFAVNQGQAQYYVEVTRPFLTWDWTYCVVKTKSGEIVASGKVTAATAERAAKALAAKIIQALYGETSVSGRTAAPVPSASGAAPGGIRPKGFVAYEELGRKFESARTFSIRSSTVWFDPADLEKALKQRPEFSGWGYALLNPDQTATRNAAAVNRLSDLTIDVNRPLFTWDWTFTIRDETTNKSLIAGRLSAISGPAAAPKLAKAIVSAIAKVRGLPAPMQQQLDQALTETKVRTWEVRHISGQSYLKSGKKVQLAVGQNTVFARDGEEVLFSVPVEELLQFSYSSNLHDRSVKWFEGWEKAGNLMFSGIGDDPNAAMGALMVALPMLAIEHGIGGLLKSSATTDHYLTLYWKDTTGVTTTTLQADEKVIRAVCAELAKFYKRSAVDLDAATQKVHTEFNEQLQNTNYHIHIEKSVALDNTVLPPDKYRVIIIQREKNLAEVYFLNERDNGIAARTMVEYARRPNADRTTRVSYTRVSGLEIFQEVQIEEHILRFSPLPVFPDEV